MIASMIGESMSMEHWWNDIDGKTAVPVENPHCNFFHHESHWPAVGLNPSLHSD